MARLRRSPSGLIVPIIKWLHYGDHILAPLRRSRNGSIAPISNTGINGRLWDISKPLLITCKMVCPEKYDLLVNALLKQAQSRVQAKAQSLEGRIIEIIHELSSNAVTPWIMTSAVLDKLNDGLSEIKKYNAHWLGRKLKMMGVDTERTTGRSRILLDQPELKKLYEQYGCNEMVMDDEENSENSDNYDEAVRLVI